jgi:hypothetical protein
VADKNTPDKITVLTTGDFMLLDLTNNQTIEAVGDTKVVHTAFIDQQVRRGRLEIVSGGKVSDEPRNPGSDPLPVPEGESVPGPLRTDDTSRVANATGEVEPTEAELAVDRDSPMGGTRKPPKK